MGNSDDNSSWLDCDDLCIEMWMSNERIGQLIREYAHHNSGKSLVVQFPEFDMPEVISDEEDKMIFLKIIDGVAVGESDLFFMGWREISLDENPKFGDLPEFVTADSFKRGKLTLEDESICQVFYLNESKYSNIFATFSMKEDSDLNELYHKFKTEGKEPSYFIALQLTGDK